MGTTSQKLTYLNGTKQKLKQAINNIGGEVTDETTFRQYANQLQNVYDNLPKTEYQEGTEITLENCLKGKLDFDNGVVGIGQSSQDSTQGYNLIPMNYGTTTTKNGMTCKITEDGRIILNGTTSELTTFFVFGNGDVTQKRITLPAGAYTGTIGKNITENVRIMINIMKTNNTQLFSGQLRYSNYENVTVNEETYIGNVNVTILGSTTLNNYELDVMVLSGTYTSSNMPNFEKYTGGQASPNPSYPQEIEVVRGKNRLNNTLTNKTQQGIEFIVNEDKTIKVNGTATGTSGVVIGQVQLTANETYTLSGCASNGGSGKYTLSVSPNGETTRLVDDTGSGATYTPTTSGIYDIRLNYWYGFNIQNLTFKPMIEPGSTSTPYLPYNTIEEVVSGKNKCESFVGVDTDVAYRGVLRCEFDIKPDTQYAISFKGTNGCKLYTNETLFTNSQYFTIGTSRITLVATTKSTIQNDQHTTDGWLILKNQSDTPSGCTFSEVQIEKNSQVTPYEPYITPTSYQLSLGDYKFYGIGTYRDYILRTTGKNKFNLGTGTYTKYGFTGTYDGSKMKVNGTTSASTNVFDPNAKSIGVFKAGSYVLSSFYTGSVNLNGHAHLMYLRSSNDLASNDNILTQFSPSVVNSSKAFTLSQDTELFMQWYANSSGIAYDNLEVMIQIEEGSTASDYQPFGVGNWYKVGKIGEVVYTGNEEWTLVSSLSNSNRTVFQTVKPTGVYKYPITPQDYNEIAKVICNKFIPTSQQATWKYYEVGFRTAGAEYIYFIVEAEVTLQDFKTNIIKDTILNYLLANPTIDIITGTLAEQLEEWWNGQTLNGTTIITSNGNLPMIIKVRGLKGE